MSQSPAPVRSLVDTYAEALREQHPNLLDNNPAPPPKADTASLIVDELLALNAVDCLADVDWSRAASLYLVMNNKPHVFLVPGDRLATDVEDQLRILAESAEQWASGAPAPTDDVVCLWGDVLGATCGLDRHCRFTDLVQRLAYASARILAPALSEAGARVAVQRLIVRLKRADERQDAEQQRADAATSRPAGTPSRSGYIDPQDCRLDGDLDDGPWVSDADVRVAFRAVRKHLQQIGRVAWQQIVDEDGRPVSINEPIHPRAIAGRLRQPYAQQSITCVEYMGRVLDAVIAGNLPVRKSFSQARPDDLPEAAQQHAAQLGLDPAGPWYVVGRDDLFVESDEIYSGAIVLIHGSAPSRPAGWSAMCGAR